ncbi:hypothetical protein M514_01310, partial [Trichuris suis]
GCITFLRRSCIVAYGGSLPKNRNGAKKRQRTIVVNVSFQRWMPNVVSRENSSSSEKKQKGDICYVKQHSFQRLRLHL